KLSALKAKDKHHDDIDRLEPMKWLNSVLMDVFVSKLNVKFALPVYDQRVAFLDSTFTLHYILLATKSHDTLKNPAGSIRSKPLKALQHRFKDKGITLIFPLNVNNTHWLVGAIFRASSTIGIFDSLIGESSNQAYHKLAYENMKKVWKVLAEAWFKDLHVPDQEWKFVVHTKIPKQGNVSDCGVFAIILIKSRFHLHIGSLFTQKIWLLTVSIKHTTRSKKKICNSYLKIKSKTCKVLSPAPGISEAAVSVHLSDVVGLLWEMGMDVGEEQGLDVFISWKNVLYLQERNENPFRVWNHRRRYLSLVCEIIGPRVVMEELANGNLSTSAPIDPT
ncbi:hypothetical protein F5050DRAFT_1716615, partial [Lentinula boryana]